MVAPFRIQRRDTAGAQTVAKTAGPADSLGSYMDRLLKMIPAEVVSLYVVGIGIIPTGHVTYHTIWAIICFIGLFAVRIWGTADLGRNLPPDWTHITISAIAFVIWVYSLGSLGIFGVWGLADPVIGSLLILVWTFFVPLFYKGPVAQ
ncbi:MAG: hypothetical protein JXM69_14435 [Anaerolineae bacterium]|nr:hypothetical protein [Anaerolineae bacterium]